MDDAEDLLLAGCVAVIVVVVVVGVTVRIAVIMSGVIVLVSMIVIVSVIVSMIVSMIASSILMLVAVIIILFSVDVRVGRALIFKPELWNRIPDDTPERAKLSKRITNTVFHITRQRKHKSHTSALH